MNIRPRTARLVLVTPDGGVVGSLPPVPVETPWWQDIGPVVSAARQHHGLDVVVLRLLETEPGGWNGGLTTYLVEVAAPVAAEPWEGVLDEQPLRNTYAKPGGPAADLAWAAAVLRERGIVPSGLPTQVRSWNLSSLWRVPTEQQTVWLKVVPPFFAHEGAMLELLADHPAPRLIARDGARMLLAEIPGDDLYDANLAVRRRLLPMLVEIQAAFAGRVEELLGIGLPDWRGPAITAGIRSVIGRTAAELPAEAVATLDGFAEALPRRFADIEACGLPDTVVHGDFHSGNTRGNAEAITILDWGDSGVGQPLLDHPAFLANQPPDAASELRALWAVEWQRYYPASDPARAMQLLAPVAAGRQAVIYRKFLDNIEPSEHVYHRSDPRDWLGRAAELVRAERVA